MAGFNVLTSGLERHAVIIFATKILTAAR
jgi:hypothetical protein